jgi:hypothetical protein
MDERISQNTSALTKVSDEAQAAFGQLSAEQLNWRPHEKGWSIGQCLEHIVITNEQFYPEFEKLAGGSRRNSFIETWSPLTGFFGRFLIKAVSEDSRKAKVPSKTVAPPSEIGADIVDRFAEHIAEINRRIDASAGADRNKTIVTSPFFVLATYSLDDAYTVLVEHTKRHVRQATRVTEASGFPKTSAAAASE